MNSLNELFVDIKKILEKYSEGLTVTEKYFDSKAKNEKLGYHLYGSKEISLFNKKPAKTFICGVIQQKNYVSFYFLPIYSHPELKEKINPELKKYLKGKSCFNISKRSEIILESVEDAVKLGIKKYEEIEWI